MVGLNINAHITEIDGASYPVCLNWVPSIGELIDLWSFSGQPIETAPFVWTKTADEIFAKVASFCQRISNSGH